MRDKKYLNKEFAKVADLLNALYANPMILSPEHVENAKEVTRDRMRTISQDLELIEQTENSGKKWTDDEMNIIEDFLSPLSDIAHHDYHEGWWREDVLMARLHRTKKSIVDKVRQTSLARKISS